MSGYKIENNFQKVMDKFKRSVTESLQETGEEILSEVKANAPRKTGELADSYEMEIENNVVTIGSPLERAAAAEFGTSKTPATAHLLPALMKAEKKLEKKLKEKNA